MPVFVSVSVSALSPFVARSSAPAPFRVIVPALVKSVWEFSRPLASMSIEIPAGTLPLSG